MASQHCYKPANETRPQKSLDCSCGYKPDNKSSYYAGQAMASNQTPLYGQYKDHKISKSQTDYYSQNQSYTPNPNMAKAPNQSYGSYRTDHTMIKTHSPSAGKLPGCGMAHKLTTYTHGHGQIVGQYAAHGTMVCHGKTKKMKEKKADCKKEKSLSKKKYRDGNRSCSDGSSSSDSDSD